MPGKNCIERFDACRHRFRSPVSNRRRIWKPMLDECADGSVPIGHSFARIARTYPESKSRACGPDLCIGSAQTQTT